MITNPSTRHFGDLLRHQRRAAGLSQEALAERAGISARGISDLERGVNRTPQRETVLLLAEALSLRGAERTAFDNAARRGASSSRLLAETAFDRHVTVPLPLTALLGRDAEVRRLTDLLRRPEVRLVTLIGPGGVGKTRLALAVAAMLSVAFPDGIHFVSLADLRDAPFVLAVLAQSMGLRAGDSRSLGQELAAHVANKRLLLVIDNFEHLLPAAASLATLLEACPRLTVLVTSRAALRLRGEHAVLVEPLAVPDLEHLPLPDALAQYPAVALFLERVREQRPRFGLSATNAATIAAVCVRLEGLPLALELAAAQAQLFSPQALLTRLERRLTVLIAGPRDLPARQHTMTATIAWSYDLLIAGEQALFRRLAVFAGGCTLETVEAVCLAGGGLDGDVLLWLRSLVDKSLLWQTEAADGAVRFGMLETIREYGLAQLHSSGERATICWAHAQYFLALAAAAEPGLRGAEQGIWLARLETEHDNLRAVLHWTLREGGDRVLGLRLACHLGYFWTMRSQYREGRQWLQEALAQVPAAEDSLRATALGHAGNLVYWLGDLAQAQVEYEEALTLWRAAGAPLRVAMALLNVGNMALEQEEYDRARALYEEALAIEEVANDLPIRVRLLNNLGVLAAAQDAPARALALYEECARVWRELGDNWGLAQQLRNIGDMASILGDLERARDCYRQSLPLLRDLDDRDGVRWTLHSLGFLARQMGDDLRAARLLAAAALLTTQLGAILGSQRQALYDQHIAALREKLGEENFAALWAEGQAMAYAHTISYALAL